jgi:RNA polymerase sigma factor (TIGR02999 family)
MPEPPTEPPPPTDQATPDTGSRGKAAKDLLAILYDELRSLAKQRMAHERRGHSLGATALVHEAYLRIAGDREDGWASRAQFFAAAAEAMRRILIEEARAHGSARKGGGRQRVTLTGINLAEKDDLDQVLAVDEAFKRLEQADPRSADVVRLRFYAGLSEEETASALGLSERTVRREWAYARAWLFDALHDLG